MSCLVSDSMSEPLSDGGLAAVEQAVAPDAAQLLPGGAAGTTQVLVLRLGCHWLRCARLASRALGLGPSCFVETSWTCGCGL